MDRLKKGDVLYEVYVNSLNQDVENELVANSEFLQNLRKSNNEMIEKINSENKHDAIVKGAFDYERESSSYDGLFYNIYLFVEWLNNVL